MNILTEDQQAKLNALPRDHEPAAYKVLVDLRRPGARKAERAHTTYVRASSRNRARLIGFWTVKTLYGGLYRRRQGLLVSRAEAYRMEASHG